METWVVAVVAVFSVMLAYRLGARIAAPPKGMKSVDRYVIAMSDGDFPQVLLSFQLDGGQVFGPFAFVPAFAHTLSDEMTIAAVRAAPKRSSRQIVFDDAVGSLGEITDDSAEYSNGGSAA